MTIRVLLADDEPLVLSGLSMIMSVAPDIEIVGTVRDGRSAVEYAGRLRPDIVVIDVRMPIMDGLEATRLLAGPDSDLSVLILTSFKIDSVVMTALRAGATGVMLKDAAPANLLVAVRAIAAGEAWLDSGIAKALIAELTARGESLLPAHPNFHVLTPREREVLILMADGLNNGEIADHLVLVEGTVKCHVSRILMKLGLRDRTQAVIMAYRNNLLGRPILES